MLSTSARGLLWRQMLSRRRRDSDMTADVRKLYVVVILELGLPFATFAHVFRRAIAESVQLLCGMMTDTVHSHKRFQGLVSLVVLKVICVRERISARSHKQLSPAGRTCFLDPTGLQELVHLKSEFLTDLWTIANAM